MDYALGFLGQYISAAELGEKPVTVTIAKVTLEKVEQLPRGDEDPGGRLRDRVVVYFKEGQSGRGWLLNRTNAESIKEMFGRETDGWLGKRVTIYKTMVRLGPKQEPGIRVMGSPDLEQPVTFQLKLPRKKPQEMTLKITGKKD